MKKILPLIGYLIGWIYPLSVNSVVVLDHFLNLKTTLMGPFDFYNDSIMGYIFFSLILSALTFAVYFICFVKPLKHYFVLLNLPLYVLSVFASFIYNDFILIAVIFLVLSITAIIYTTTVSIKIIKEETA